MFARNVTSISLVSSFLLAGLAVACGSEEGAPPPVPAAAPPAEAPEAPSGDLATGTPPPPPPAPPICAQATGEYAASREPSNVLFLLDRSGSMHIELPSGDTRWASMEAGLFDLLAALPATTQAGAMMFPQGDAPVNAWCGIDASINDVHCKSGWPEPGQTARCAESTYKVGVASALLAPGQVGSIQSYVHSSDDEFYWGTPLATAVSAAIDAQRASTLPGTRSVILLTDGNPTSCDEAGISNDVSNVANAAAAGLTGTLVRTFVIGIVDGARQAAKAENLSPIAVAGGTARYPGCEAKSDCFYPVTQTGFAADLKKAFDDISTQAFDCTFNLPPASANTDPAQINVELEKGTTKTPVGRDAAHQNGWDYLPGGKQIQLYGQACQDMKDASAKLSIVLGCKTILAPSYQTH